jgi:hypothetical protein
MKPRVREQEFGASVEICQLDQFTYYLRKTKNVFHALAKSGPKVSSIKTRGAVPHPP